VWLPTAASNVLIALIDFNLEKYVNQRYEVLTIVIFRSPSMFCVVYRPKLLKVGKIDCPSFVMPIPDLTGRP
jgi:hypothetical protein